MNSFTRRYHFHNYVYLLVISDLCVLIYNSICLNYLKYFDNIIVRTISYPPVCLSVYLIYLDFRYSKTAYRRVIPVFNQIMKTGPSFSLNLKCSFLGGGKGSLYISLLILKSNPCLSLPLCEEAS